MMLSHRVATREDLPQIVAIYNSTVPSRMVTADLEPVSVESRVPWFEEHSPGTWPLWVVEQDGVIAAWLSFSAWNRRAGYRRTAELSVYVHDDYRRRGIAGYLLEQALAAAPELQLDNLIGLIFAHNAPSLGLFERFGFAHWGLLPKVTVLDGIERDVVILGRRV
jgi:phosphinothricin acetyltransferase